MADGSLLHVEHVMGTVFSIDVRDADALDDEAIQATVAWLHWVDATFSTYRADSDISRLGRGELAAEECHPEVTAVLERCAGLSHETRGFFSARAHGTLDPAAYVKGWAIERAVALLHAHGARRLCVNGGGDIRATAPATAPPWRVGIVDPADRSQVLTVATGRDLAVATSGTAERGRHVTDPLTGRPATSLASLTVTGPDLGVADAYATAGLAMGPAARDWLEGLDGYEGFAVKPDRTIWWTRGFPLG